MGRFAESGPLLDLVKQVLTCSAAAGAPGQFWANAKLLLTRSFSAPETDLHAPEQRPLQVKGAAARAPAARRSDDGVEVQSVVEATDGPDRGASGSATTGCGDRQHRDRRRITRQLGHVHARAGEERVRRVVRVLADPPPQPAVDVADGPRVGRAVRERSDRRGAEPPLSGVVRLAVPVRGIPDVAGPDRGLRVREMSSAQPVPERGGVEIRSGHLDARSDD